MATNAPKSRKTHIVRIVGTNKDGERLDDIWVDLERMDIIKSATQVPPNFQWQGHQRKLRWCDDPDSSEEEYFQNGPPSRVVEIVKVCDPESDDVDDPDEWVPVPIIKAMRSKGGGSEDSGQGFEDRFVNTNDEEENNARIFEVRKIVHYDTNIDDDAQAAFDADPDRTNYVVPAEFYEKDFGTKDESQGVEHEILRFFKSKGNSSKVMGLGRQTKLHNQYLIDESEAPEGDVIGISGINPPYRFDPYQNIVNVQLSQNFIVALQEGVGEKTEIITKNDKPLAKFLGSKTRDSISFRFYKVKSSLKDPCLRTTMSPTFGTLSAAPDHVILVFPLTGDDDQTDVDQAFDSIMNWFEPAVFGTSPLIPVGCLFSSGVCAIPSSTVLWKLTSGHYRSGTMAQAFPVSMSPTFIDITANNPPRTIHTVISGFSVQGYRFKRHVDDKPQPPPPEWRTHLIFNNGGPSDGPGVAFATKLPPVTNL